MMHTNSKNRFYTFGTGSGILRHGRKNSIADVAGVTVGHLTKVRQTDIRTGVTVVDPGIRDLFKKKIPAAIAVGNGFGKIAGSTQVDELGVLEAPIVLTNTLAVGVALRGTVDLVLSKNRTAQSVNVVVGETNDGFLNNIRKNTVTGTDVKRAYESRSVDFRIGNVGAGTGTRAFSWKGGIGTSSRIFKIHDGVYHIGVLAQTNYGGSLAIGGVPVGELLGKHDFKNSDGDGSCMIVIATDAPLTSRQLKRLARRAFLGLARTGSVMSNGSGDYAIAFSTSREGLEGSGAIGSCVKDDDLTIPFLAVAEAVEESVYDAMFAAETMKGRDGNVLDALPKEKVIRILREKLK